MYVCTYVCMCVFVPYLDLEYYCKLGSSEYPDIEAIKEKSEFLKMNIILDIQKYFHSNGYEIKETDIKIVESLDELKKEKDLYKISKHVVVNHYVDIEKIDTINSTIDDTFISRSLGKIPTIVCFQNTKQAKALPDFIGGYLNNSVLWINKDDSNVVASNELVNVDDVVDPGVNIHISDSCDVW